MSIGSGGVHRARAALMAGVSLLAIAPLTAPACAQSAPAGQTMEIDTADMLPPVPVTAEQELKQAPGVSVITSEDIMRMPPTNDISEIVRQMPGVNLTGNSSSGQYGNNRQIDLRGMGPENTLIMIDGKPVRSRNSIRMGRSGERNTRGDSNWVPAEAIERIEVIRGPAAARYGSGAAGGVVNIITKAPTEKLSGSVTAYGKLPEDSREGDTRRLGFNVTGPLTKGLSFRAYGNYNRTDADSLDLNRAAANTAAGDVPPAGREGVENKDVNALLRWDINPQNVLELEGGYSRQGNIYAGDRAVSTTGSPLLDQLAGDGAETNIMYRRTASLTHRGSYDFGTSRLMFLYEGTNNQRLNEGLAGGSEGSINTDTDYTTSRLRNYTANGELNIPLTAFRPQTLTVGAEFFNESLDDPASVTQGMGTGGAIPGLATGTRSSESDAQTYAAFLEDNIEVTKRLTVTPGVRFDHHSTFGSNFSPSLNASYGVTDTVTIKGGIARAFKAPNLYQSNPNYLYYTMGNGCPFNYPSLGAGCYVMGNPNLKPEVSINKEIGVSYSDGGWNTSLTYFHNDYRDKIIAGDVPEGVTNTNGRIFRWDNTPKATVQGLEGNLLVPLHSRVSWNTNFTYMIENKDDTTGQPLSIIPRYTINSAVTWQAMNDLSLTFGLTHYGKQKPRTTSTSTGAAVTGDALAERSPYTIFNISSTWFLNDHVHLTTGISNILDERLYREANSSGAGANTYNEPGRAYYLSLTASF